MMLILYQFDIEVAYHKLDSQNLQKNKNTVNGECAF